MLLEKTVDKVSQGIEVSTVGEMINILSKHDPTEPLIGRVITDQESVVVITPTICNVDGRNKGVLIDLCTTPDSPLNK